MRTIPSRAVEDAVSALCVKANLRLPDRVFESLLAALARETNRRSRGVLEAVVLNARIAASKKLAVCQDTGVPVVFVELGGDARVRGDLIRAINRGVERGYRGAALRASVVRDPLERGAPGYGPAVVHIDIVPGEGLQITLLPKGFGCENKSALKMLKPTDSLEAVGDFVVETVRAAGPDACPPYVVGVGIGGTADQACVLAKKALVRKTGVVRAQPAARAREGAGRKWERALLDRINRLKIGPMGLGGKTTALDVLIETAPTHIAGLPVAVNISCHALRAASVKL